MPILKLTQYGLWTTEHSLLSTVSVLINDGQKFLGGIVLIFSILLPITKLLYLLLVSTLRKPPVTAALWAGLDTASVPDRWSDRRLLRGYVWG